ncbi:MAG: PAS domain-containing protein [Pseudomonadota bacterium]
MASSDYLGLGPGLVRHVEEETALRECLDLLSRTAIPLCIADDELEDQPIVCVNSEFERLAGRSSDEILGKNCRFLQGLETHSKDVIDIRNAIRRKNSGCATVLNYRSDGSAFINRINFARLSTSTGRTFSVGFQTGIDVQLLRDLGLSLASVSGDERRSWISPNARQVVEAFEMRAGEARRMARLIEHRVSLSNARDLVERARLARGRGRQTV